MKYYLIAGEASGDLHASHLMQALKQRDEAAEFRFFGGKRTGGIDEADAEVCGFGRLFGTPDALLLDGVRGNPQAGGIHQADGVTVEDRLDFYYIPSRSGIRRYD